MRIVLLTLVTAVLAWSVWTFLSDPQAETPDEPAPPPVEPAPVSPEDERANSRARLTTGTLVVTVRDAKGGVPEKAKAGYRHAGEDRVRFVNKQGQVRFTDAPLGTLTVLARAPGFKADEQKKPMTAGVPADVYFVLRPEEAAEK